MACDSVPLDVSDSPDMISDFFLVDPCQYRIWVFLMTCKLQGGKVANSNHFFREKKLKNVERKSITIFIMAINKIDKEKGMNAKKIPQPLSWTHADLL